MNTLFQKITAGLSMALLLSLTSCEKDNLLTPTQPGSARSGGVDDGIVVGIPQIHKLTRYGDATLTYADNGQLLTVTTFVRGPLAIQADYTYSPGKIRAFTHQGKVVLHDETFTLDASGRCTESLEKGLNGADDIRWIFQYDEKGYLLSCKHFGSAAGSVVYNRNADGDMVGARVSYNSVSGVDITFAYNKPTGAPLLSDKYPLNVSVPELAVHDTYLRIFGKPSKHLLKQVSYEPAPGSTVLTVPSDLFYIYTLDPDGYVTKKIEYNGQSGTLPKTTLYDYVLTNITVQL